VLKNGYECTVLESGVVPGSAPVGELRYQLTRFEDGDENGAAIIFRLRPGQRLTPLACSVLPDGEWEHRSRPRVLKSRYGLLLALPPVEQGTAGFEGARLFAWRGNSWRAVDLEIWHKSLRQAGYDGWKGVLYNFQELTGETLLYKPKDIAAHPSKRATLRFSIENDALALTNLSVKPIEWAR
jgi:hypothetical protein